MSTLHQSLVELRNALGYAKQDSGVCALYANMAINAFLIGELNTFHERCASIKKKMKEPAFLNLIKKLRASSYSTIKETGSTEEQKELAELMDVMAFIESGELYLKPELYPHVFAKSLSQSYKVAISAFAQSKELEQRGGRALAKSFVGIYTFEELKNYIRLLNCLAENVQQDFALNLSSDIHSIGLCYSHGSKSWQLFDANQPELLPIPSKSSNWEECLAVQIKQAFLGDTYILFQSVIWTTGLTAPGFRKSMSTFSGDFHTIPSYNVLTNARGFSLIHLAARDGEVDALRFCVEAKDQNGNYRVDLNNTNKNGATPAFLAAQNGHVKALQLLLEAQDKDGAYRVNLNNANKNGATPIYMAAQNGHVKALQLLLEAQDKDGTYRVDLNNANKNGATPVFMAAQNGHVKVLQLLLEAQDKDGTYRLDLNNAKTNGVTPVFLAAQNGHVKALQLLLEAKVKDGNYRVDVNKPRVDGATPIYMAAQNGHVKVLQLLLEAKDKDGVYRVDLNNTTKNAVTPLYIAAEAGHIEVLRLLLGAKNKDGSYRADLNKSQEDGATPVYIAAQNGHVKALQLLLEAKDKDGANRADLNKSRVYGATPVFIAAQKGHKAVIIELLKHDVDINLAIKSSVGALKQFAQNRDQAVIKKMSEFTKSKAEAEELLMKPKDIAWVMGHDDIVNLFERKKVVEQIQASIKTIETPMSLVGTMNIPSAYRLHQVLNKGLKAYKDKVYECTPSALKELNAEFKRSCKEVQQVINDTGLSAEPRYGDAINNVLTAIINALNHLLSLPAKVMSWDNGYTLFHRKDYTSPEIRTVFGELGKISQVIADQCEPIQSSIQV